MHLPKHPFTSIVLHLQHATGGFKKFCLDNRCTTADVDHLRTNNQMLTHIDYAICNVQRHALWET